MDCVIKIVKGPEEGQEFRLSTAEAVVGRSARSQVRLASPTVSFEHAVISRGGQDFFVENLSANGTFVNDERITGKVRLRAKDQLRFGEETFARVEAVPASSSAATRRWMLYGAAALALVLLGLWVWSVVVPAGPVGFSVKDAYPRLDTYVEEQIARRNLPPQSLDLMREGWRLEMASNHKAALPLWNKLNVLLALHENTMAFQDALRDNPQALQRVAKTDPRAPLPTDDELKAALVQFVTRMSRSK